MVLAGGRRIGDGFANGVGKQGGAAMVAATTRFSTGQGPPAGNSLASSQVAG